MTHSLGPLVTLGLPVFNGREYVEAAVRSLQTQTWRRLEILISDNASTDDTEAICRRLARDDERIRYVRQASNIGAARNFEYLAGAASGELFAWCAHDDVRLPRFVEACVHELARRPDAVLCNSAIEYLDEAGQIRADLQDLNFGTCASTRPQRARQLIDHFHWAEMYGLMRIDALRKALPWEPVWGFDVVLSMKMLMMGEFAKVEEPLFRYRVRRRYPAPQETMAVVLGRSYDRLDPYTEMFESLARAALGAAETEAEKAEMLWTFLEVATDPHSPDWGAALASEHRLLLSTSLAPFSRWVLECLRNAMEREPHSSGSELLRLLVAGAARVVVAVANERRGDEVDRVCRSLRVSNPSAKIVVVCHKTWVEEASRVHACSEVVALSKCQDGVGDDVEVVRRLGPRLVIWTGAVGPDRIEDAALGLGAPLGIAVAFEEHETSRSWFGGASDRLRSRWTFVIPSQYRGTELVDFISGSSYEEAARIRKVALAREAMVNARSMVCSLRSEVGRRFPGLRRAWRSVVPADSSPRSTEVRD